MVNGIWRYLMVPNPMFFKLKFMRAGSYNKTIKNSGQEEMEKITGRNGYVFQKEKRRGEA